MVRGYRPALQVETAYKARFCQSFKVFVCSKQFFIALFCTDCLATTSEGLRYNNQLLRAIITKISAITLR